MRALLCRLFADEQGLETVEYAILTALILGGILLTAKLLGLTLATRFTSVNTAMAE